MKYLTTKKVYEKPIYQYIRGKLPNRKGGEGWRLIPQCTLCICVFIYMYIYRLYYIYVYMYLTMYVYNVMYIIYMYVNGL